MANQDPFSHIHHASAFGVSGQISRPVSHTLSPQAAVTLAPMGGQGSHRVDSYTLPGVLSFGAAYVNVGGSLDESNQVHTTFSCAVVQDLNICDVVTADKIVSRLTIYHPPQATGAKRRQPSFSITGSHFKNLVVAGQKINVELASKDFHDNTYDDFCTKGNGKWLIGANINRKKLDGQRKLLEHNYDIVKGLADRFDKWDPHKQQPAGDHHYRCSPANLLDLTPVLGAESEIRNFGCVICVPRFGIIYLAELLIYHYHRHLTMIRVQMCSPGEGTIDGAGTGGGGGGPMPPRPSSS